MKNINVILGLPHEGKTNKLIEMFVASLKLDSDTPESEKKALVFISAEDSVVSIIDLLVNKFDIPFDIASRLPIYNINHLSEVELILLEYLRDNDTILFLDEPQLLHRVKKYHHIPLHTKLEILVTKYPVDDFKSLDIIYTKSIVRK